MEADQYGDLVGSIDQGSGSSRFMVFSSKTGEPVAFHQIESKTFVPQERWVEMDASWLIQSVQECIEKTVIKLQDRGISHTRIKCIGITNQMLTSVFWDKQTGDPLYNALLYSDTRAHDQYECFVNQFPDRKPVDLQKHNGMPFNPVFLQFKIPWMLENVDKVREAHTQGRMVMGTVNTWILWNLTGGVNGGQFVTDLTNAAHTGLLNLFTLKWDKDTCNTCGVPMSILPEIRSTSEVYGYMQTGSLKGIPISGMIGDQPSSTVGQLCFEPGHSKCTYGTVASLNINTGSKVVVSQHGLLSSPLYQIGQESPIIYTLEVFLRKLLPTSTPRGVPIRYGILRGIYRAITDSCGFVVKWLRDNMGFIQTSAEIEKLAGSVEGTNDCYFVTAMEGFFCPYWNDTARGTICGLTRSTTKAHICRAALEAVCFQVAKLLEIAAEESGYSIPSLRVDGGMARNNLVMQLQADLMGENVELPTLIETTAFGAALMAGAAKDVNLFKVSDDRRKLDVSFSEQTLQTFTPTTTPEDRARRKKRWEKAVEKSFNWTQD